MAYCKECGAYIPDGHSKCLACGFDEAAAAAKAAEEAKKSAQAYEYKYEEPRRVDSDFLREQLEQQRRRQQENSRKWAETEKAQREKTRQSHQQHSGTRSTDTKKYNAPSNISSSKIFAAISYFGILFALPYLLCKEDEFAIFHAKQGMILFIAGIIGKIAGSILGLGWLVSIAKIYFIYKGLSSVLNGRKDKLPYIGSLL